jgi:quercetin dioxygenase-like cupin family protein
MEPYVLGPGEGRKYSWNDFDFTVKAGREETHGGLAFMEFVTRKGEEPGEHVHVDEDEIFYVLEGSLVVSCGGQTLAANASDFVFLPRNIPHSYSITSDGVVRMLVLTTPSGFGDRIESGGTRLA